MKNYITHDSAEKATPIFESNQASITHPLPWISQTQFLSTLSTTLLDFAVILQLLTVNKSSKIPYIWFTVNYCNMHCIMGIYLLSLQ